MRLPFLPLVLILVLMGCQQAPPETNQQPNIIFILADDLGYGDLGSYGQTQIQTPNLDQMAAEGMRFTNHYAGSTVCAPSRCVLMTGKHTGNCRIRGNAVMPLQPDDVTVAEVLQEAGYTTGLIGKWGLGESGSTGIPNKQGFDYFYGYLNQIRAHNFYPDYLWRNEEQVPLANEVEIVQETYAKGIGSYATKKVDYSHDLFTEEALSFVTTHQADPFFLYLAYTIPHANNESHLNNEHGMEVPDYGIYADMDWPDVEKGMAAMVSRLDTDVGRLLEHLRALGLSENTLVIFTSDNGPHREGWHDANFFDSNGPLRGIKRALYEGGIRVPMLAWWPSRIAPNQTSDHPSAFWDFLPTAADIAGIASPSDSDGTSYLPTLLGNEQEPPPYLYWEFYEGGSAQAVRAGPWKAVRKPMFTGSIELYNLSTDLGESTDVALQYPSVVDSLRQFLEQAHTPSPDWVPPRR